MKTYVPGILNVGKHNIKDFSTVNGGLLNGRRRRHRGIWPEDVCPCPVGCPRLQRGRYWKIRACCMTIQ
jgi:hypothetical protein